MTDDLWPVDIGESKLTSPVSILRKQAALLTEKTGGLVKAEVTTQVVSNEMIHNTFVLVVPALEGYFLQFLERGSGFLRMPFPELMQTPELTLLLLDGAPPKFHVVYLGLDVGMRIHKCVHADDGVSPGIFLHFVVVRLVLNLCALVTALHRAKDAAPLLTPWPPRRPGGVSAPPPACPRTGRIARLAGRRRMLLTMKLCRLDVTRP